MDWKDEEVLMDIVEHDEEECKSPMDIVLKVLRREKLFEKEHKNWTEFKPTIHDPFKHIYEFYGVEHVFLAKEENVWKRMRQLFWTLQNMWYLGSRFDVDGCLRVPALVNPIEWQYCVALKMIWDGIKFLVAVNKLHPCSEKHCGLKDANSKTIQFLKKIMYAFDFNEAQLYDWRYLGYLLRHTLFNKLFHCLSKHAGKYQMKVLAKQKKKKFGCEMAQTEEYRFVLDYLRYLVVANNMFEFFSPSQIGKLWEYASGTFEELRMIYPEISLHVIENEYCDLTETQRHNSVTKRMTARSYKHYFGSEYFRNKEPKIWRDARGVVKAYATKNILHPIPDVFAGVWQGHKVAKHEYNPSMLEKEEIDNDEYTRYVREKLDNYINEIVKNIVECPVSLYLTEIKYPFILNLLKWCTKYDMSNYAQVIINTGITKAFSHFQYVPNPKARKNPFLSNIEYQNLSESAKRKIETKFPWPYILFIEYLSFNPRQFYRERHHQVITETRAVQDSVKQMKSKRKLVAARNRVVYNRRKYDAWMLANENNTIPIYTFAVLLRFAACERSNATRTSEDDEIETEGTDFATANCFISALKTILKFPQLATRILINTHNLKWMVNDLAYKEFKDTYKAIFKYEAKYQEHPKMYDLFKEKWQQYGDQVKSLLDIYHEPQHRLHRELVWIGFYQYHQNVYGPNKSDEDRNKLFDYHKSTHLQNVLEKCPNYSIEQQHAQLTDDAKTAFAAFTYADDTEHRWYGNYYRDYVETEEVTDDEDDSDDDDDDEEDGSTKDDDDKKSSPPVDSDEKQQGQTTPYDDEDDSFVSDSASSGDKEESTSTSKEEQKEKKHRRTNTDIEERNQFASKFHIDGIDKNEDDQNVFAKRYEDSDESEEETEKAKAKAKAKRRKSKKKIKVPSVNTSDEMISQEEETGKNIVSDTKARGSNEFDSEDIKQINKASVESPSLSNISEDKVVEKVDESEMNPFGKIDDMEQKDDVNNQKASNQNQQQQQQDNDGNNNNDDANNDNQGQNGQNGHNGQNGFDGNTAGDDGDDDGDKKKKKNEKSDDDDKKKKKKKKKKKQKDDEDDGDKKKKKDEKGNDDDKKKKKKKKKQKGDEDDDDKKKKKKKKKQKQDDADDDKKEEKNDDEFVTDEDEAADTLSPLKSELTKAKKHKREGSDIMSEAIADLASSNVNVEEEELALAKQYKDKSNRNNESDDYQYDDHELKVNIGDTRSKIKRGDTKRRGLIFDKKITDKAEQSGDDDDDDDDHDDDMDGSDEENGREFKPNKQWAETLVNNPNILGMQSRDAMLQRAEEQQDLYKRHQIIRMKEDEEENLYSIFEGMKDSELVDRFMHGKEQLYPVHEEVDALVTDIVQKQSERGDQLSDDHEANKLFDDRSEANAVFSDETFFQIKNRRWKNVGKSDPISSINKKVADNSYIMLRDMTEPLALSDLLGDFQKAGQIMLGRIDDMQASLIVENKLHSGVLKAHQLDSKNCYIEKEELQNTIEKLENELKLLRDKRDENKAETAALKTKKESYILKYNELKEVSTQKLRDQLRCFEIYKAQTTQLERRIHDVSYQTEIGYKRLRRLDIFKKQQQLNISQLDIEIESMEKEKNSLQSELANLESEQDEIDNNERQYVLRLKEQLRRLGKGMEQKEKSCNIFRRNVVEERLRIHTIDDSLKKLRTNANPTTTSDQELINATQHEALQAREKYAEKTQQHSFLTNIHDHEKNLILAIEKVQWLDDQIYAQKWNIIQKSWNLRKHLLTTAKYIQMKKWLLKEEQKAKRHQKQKSMARFRKDSQKGLSIGGQQQFKKHSQDFSNH